MKGDLNGDGKVSLSDVNYLLKYISNDKTVTCTNYLGDMNNDNNCNLADVNYLLNYISNKPNYNLEYNNLYKLPKWAENGIIYEVNIRQYTIEGTFSKFYDNLENIFDLGVNILWFMPIHPIGLEKRKGTLGSYYSIKNYHETNSEFGTINDFKKIVNKCHELGMYVILDWVANHTSWDHDWVISNNDYYTKVNGEMTDPIKSNGGKWGWTDVADLNYNNIYLWHNMIDEMKFWINEINIDGFRCDVAGEVPANFWIEARHQLEKVKNNIFFLAETEVNNKSYYKNAFDINYGWTLHSNLKSISNNLNSNLLKNILDNHLNKNINDKLIQLYFLTNHDENSWIGTIKDFYGDKWQIFAILNYTIPKGIPMIYSGEEYGDKKQLEFYEKDLIDFSDTSRINFYKKLNNLKRNQKCLNNLNNNFKIISTNNNYLFIYERFDDMNNNIRVILNLNDGRYNISNYIKENYEILLEYNYNNLIIDKLGFLIFK